jgi:sphinganine-1-phosphate aldolase
MFALSNPLHPDVFPFTRKMEAEIISMCLRLFNGGEDSCGVMTSGGTESIMLAMKAYRDWARAEKGIVSPEIIIAKTAHAAFHKAGSTFGIDVIEVDVDPKTFRLTVEAVRPYVGRNTIAIVGSSPNFPQGVIDDIPNLSKFAESRGIPFHNDCCLGSFMLPFAEKLGYPISTFDFRNSGITSISMDTHKYGYAPKGSSVVMYSNPKYRQYQYYTSPDWSGGIYATPGFAGSRPGALVAVTWATLLRVGAEGYEATVSATLETAAAIRKGISSIPGLLVLGDSELSVVCIGTTPESGLSAYSVADKMTQLGWNLNSLQNPACFHICCTYLQRDKAPAFLSDLSRAVELAPANDGKGAAAAMYGMAGSLPDSSLVGEAAKIYLDEFYTI